MKKQLIVIGAAILLLALGLSGCFGDNNKDKENGESSEVNSFIGMWKTTPYRIENGTRIDEPSSNATIYNNGTMRTESVYDNEIMWTPYIIENNQICFGEAGASDYYCYDFEFSNNGTKVTLVTIFQDPDTGETFELFVEMIKNR